MKWVRVSVIKSLLEGIKALGVFKGSDSLIQPRNRIPGLL